MTLQRFFCAGTTQAAHFAARFLAESGVELSNSPEWNVNHLLLDVPSFRPGSILNDNSHLDTLLNSLPPHVTVWGGNLDHHGLKEFHRMDLLKNESYLVENAHITAQCALKLVLPLLQSPVQESPVLIIGWGRIGKHLAASMIDIGFPVSVAVRNCNSIQKLQNLGYQPLDSSALKPHLPQFRLIINTAPADILSFEDVALCQNCIKMDLASKKGIAGDDVMWARGLPGIHAPEQSGQLIAQTILQLLKEEKE